MVKKEKKTWLRIEVIKTGDDYIPRERYTSCIRAGCSLVEPPLDLEEVVYSLSSNENKTVDALVDLIRQMDADQKEIKRLNSIIKEFQEAQKKVMGVK